MLQLVCIKTLRYISVHNNVYKYCPINNIMVPFDDEEKKRKYMREYYRRPEVNKRMTEYAKRYRSLPDKKEKMRLYLKEYHRTYNQLPDVKERHKLLAREYRKKAYVKEKMRIHDAKKWREKYPQYRKRRVAYLQSERGKQVASVHASNYRARKNNAPGRHTVKEWLAIRDRSPICPMCGRFVECENLTKDHVIPLSKGGANNASNLQPLCFSCNAKKWNTHYQK